LAFVIVPTLILQAVMFERRRATLEAERSDQRYRAFVANSSESIFRTELAEPMPITLPVDEQIDWLRKHMFVAECNPAFLAAQGITAPAGGAGGTNPGTHPPWSNWYLERVREAIANNYQVKDIEHILPGPYGLDRVMLISMFGVVEKGMLTRIWGTGRDVTAMRQAQASLAAHDQKLRELATEITLAEERARRKLAADLHEGPAQNLVALSLELSAMKRVVSDEHTAAKLGELERLTSDTNQQVRTLMAELMPPGLYDGGIVAGVRWLADGMSRQRRLLVSVEDDGVPKPLDEHAAVLLFQTVRELLHNVAKHSRARQAAVRMTADGNQLHIDVIDPGVGFDPDQLGALPQTHRGFGLFSIRERLALMGGTLRISSTIGSGTRVRVTAPLPPQGRLFNQARSA
jgi:signal transduction histidine kinase